MNNCDYCKHKDKEDYTDPYEGCYGSDRFKLSEPYASAPEMLELIKAFGKWADKRSVTYGSELYDLQSKARNIITKNNGE